MSIAILGREDSQSYFSGSRARLLKEQNVVWMHLPWLGVFGITRLFCSLFWAALLAACIVLRPFLSDTHVNNLTTELVAAVFLTFGTLALVRGVLTDSLAPLVFAGLLPGGFAPCKAAGKSRRGIRRLLCSGRGPMGHSKCNDFGELSDC